MTTAITTRAPGKLILTGEYAVLEGAPALSAAVDLYAEVGVVPVQKSPCELEVVNTGECFRFDVSADGAIAWQDAAGDKGALLAAVVRTIARAGGAVLTDKPCRISIDTRDFYAADAKESVTKKGIGSSGAVAVALTHALCAWADVKPEPAFALQAHSEFQQKKGSGLDVLTSWHGGVIRFAAGNPPRLEQVVRSDALLLLPVWTGVAASTSEMLTRLEHFGSSAKTEYQDVFVRVCGAAETAAQAWSVDAGAFVAAVAQLAEALKHLDDAGDIGIWSEPHRQLGALAAEAGVSYKPSGAGGGDYGIAFAIDESSLESFRRAATHSGFLCEGPGWSAGGVTTEINR